MGAREVIWTFVLALTLMAAISDWRTHKIPNWLTVSGAITGVFLRSVISGWSGAKASLEGAGLALALLLPLVLLRALGAGDWKLVGAVGAFLGPILVLFILFGSIVGSALMGTVQMIKTKRVRETLMNIVVLVRGFAIFGFQPNPKVSLDNPDLMKVPFGVAVAAATLVCFVVARLVQS
jgi:prepilin peptidase CpaA